MEKCFTNSLVRDSIRLLQKCYRLIIADLTSFVKPLGFCPHFSRFFDCEIPRHPPQKDKVLSWPLQEIFNLLQYFCLFMTNFAKSQRNRPQERNFYFFRFRRCLAASNATMDAAAAAFNDSTEPNIGMWILPSAAAVVSAVRPADSLPMRNPEGFVKSAWS